MTRITAIGLALPLLLATLATDAADQESPKIPQGTSEPTKCYRALANSGLNLTVGVALEACGGSLDASKTVGCFIEAWAPTEQGGLGLTIGQGIDLCRVGGKRQT